MRILQINNYHYLKGGSEKVYLETSRLLEEMGHSVIHFSVNDMNVRDSPTREYFVSPMDYPAADSPFHRKIGAVFRLIYSGEAKERLERLVEKERPDVAHLHIFYGRITSSILPVLEKHHIPTVMTLHEYRMMCPVSILLNKDGEICEKCAGGDYIYCAVHRCNRGHFLYSVVSALESYFRDYCFPYDAYVKRFVAVSRFLMNKHLQHRPRLKEKMVHIYNFIDSESYVPKHEPGHYYLYVGRLSREKGIMTLLEACKRFPKLSFKIVGDGPLMKIVLEFKEKNRLSHVELKGYLTGETLSDIIKDSKFLIVPSECYETFGMNIVESFAYGKPVIASNIGAIPEIVEDGKTGFLFQSGDVDALSGAINIAEGVTQVAYKVLSHDARNCVETRFNKDIYYRKLMDVYREIA